MASRDLAASASIPSGKKNSRGAWHLRQIEVNYEVLPQVRHDVTERRSANAAEPVDDSKTTEELAKESQKPHSKPHQRPLPEQL